MLFSRETFDRVGGFDEDMPRNYNDTDFCMRVRGLGLRNVVEMTAELLHSEGASLPDQGTAESLTLLARENRVFAKKWPGEDLVLAPEPDARPGAWRRDDPGPQRRRAGAVG